MLFDHYSSVVYRYQGEPHCPQPNLPTFAECRPRYPGQMSCDESWKVGNGKKGWSPPVLIHEEAY